MRRDLTFENTEVQMHRRMETLCLYENHTWVSMEKKVSIAFVLFLIQMISCKWSISSTKKIEFNLAFINEFLFYNLYICFLKQY